MKKVIGLFALLLAAVIFGSFGIWIRILDKEISLYEQIILRNVIAMVIAGFVIVLGRKYKVDFKKIPKLSLLIYFFAVPVTVIFYNISILNTRIAIAIFAFYVGTILGSWIISLLVFREKITVTKILSLCAALVGLILFAWPFELSALGLGFAAGIIAGVLDAVSNATRKNLSDKSDKFLLVFITMIGGVLISGIMLAVNGGNLGFISEMSSTAWLVGLVFGGILVGVNYLLLKGFQNFDLSLGTIVLASELFFATLFGYMIFTERPALNEIIGGMFILLAVAIPNLSFLGRRRE